MDRAQRPFDRLLPPGQGLSSRLVLVAFVLWPVAVLLSLRGFGLGLGTLGLMVASVSLAAFRRIRDEFPPSPARRVVTGFSVLYLVIVCWLVLGQSAPVALAMVGAAAWLSARTLLRPVPEAGGLSTAQVMANRARLQWELEHASGNGGDEDDDGPPTTRRFHWPDL